MLGENMVESEFIEPWKGMWMSSIFLAPLGIFLTYKAANDSALFDREAYKRIFASIGYVLVGWWWKSLKKQD